MAEVPVVVVPAVVVIDVVVVPVVMDIDMFVVRTAATNDVAGASPLIWSLVC